MNPNNTLDILLELATNDEAVQQVKNAADNRQPVLAITLPDILRGLADDLED